MNLEVPGELKPLLSPRIPATSLICLGNPKMDGNCGFRSLAIAIRGDEEKWWMVKLAMKSHLAKCRNVYEEWLGYDISLLLDILECKLSPCSSKYWFMVPDCAQLAADTFRVPVAMMGAREELCSLFLPLLSPPAARRDPIILHWVNDNHLMHVAVKSGAIIHWPSLNPQHKPICDLYELEDYWSGLFHGQIVSRL